MSEPRTNITDIVKVLANQWQRVNTGSLADVENLYDSLIIASAHDVMQPDAEGKPVVHVFIVSEAEYVTLQWLGEKVSEVGDVPVWANHRNADETIEFMVKLAAFVKEPPDVIKDKVERFRATRHAPASA